MSQRITIGMSAVLAGIIFVGVMSAVLSDGFFADFLLDRNSRFPYPFTVQNIMWLVFFIGAGELLVRYIESDREMLQIHKSARTGCRPKRSGSMRCGPGRRRCTILGMG